MRIVPLGLMTMFVLISGCVSSGNYEQKLISSFSSITLTEICEIYEDYSSMNSTWSTANTRNVLRAIEIELTNRQQDPLACRMAQKNK